MNQSKEINKNKNKYTNNSSDFMEKFNSHIKNLR